jgi:starch phosphorylase
MSDATSSGPYDGRRDLEQAVADLADQLPPSLAPLARVAFNYAWSWIPGGPALFREIDPDRWLRSGGSPRFLLESVAPHRFRGLAHDAGFRARMAAVVERLDRMLARASGFPQVPPAAPVAYVCSEFGIHHSLPLYGGGLGVLAGDVQKASSDLALPMVGLGLLYRQGYFHQRLDSEGGQIEFWVETPVERLPIALVTGERGAPLTVGVELRGRRLTVQVWRVEVGRGALFLLDTDREDNDPIDRWITARLYVGDRQTRLAQYAVLGIAGVRALDVLGVRPSVVHLNEGHGALGTIERVRQLVQSGTPFDAALAAVRRTTVFTTHTPIPAGNESYGRDEVEAVLAAYLDGSGLPRDRIYALGDSGDGRLGMTVVALRTSRAANAVSRRHGEVARAMWHAVGAPIGHVTNGVHVPTWMAPAMQALLDRHFAPDWRERLDDPATWEPLARVPDGELWALRSELRAALISLARARSVRDRLGRSEPADYVAAAARVLDPAVLTLGFARRVATYKRLHLLTRRLDRALRLLAGDRPVQLVIAGKAHPQDEPAKDALRQVFAVRRAPNVGARVVFLEDYDLEMAPLIVAGCDVWLNLPRPPMEASGTSGMKASMNGALNLSVLDGWWAEAFDGENGWGLPSGTGDWQAQDDQDADTVLNLVEREVVPLFYDRGADGLPHGWLARVRRSLATLGPRFGAERMMKEYAATMYAPAPGDR